MPRLLLALLLIALPGLALAHAVKLFAAVEGGAIVGEVYFAGGGPAAGAEVVALDPEGAVLGRATTDAEGRFRLPVTRRVDHRLLADTGGGHAGAFLMPADSLPAVAEGGAPSADVKAAVEAAVSRQVTPLRRDLARLEERILWRDVLGGLGYILGLFGLAAFLLVRRRDN